MTERLAAIAFAVSQSDSAADLGLALERPGLALDLSRGKR